MDGKSLPYQKQIFVCVNRRETGASCDPRGGSVIRERLKNYVKENGLKGRVRVSQSGCMDLCSQGPNVMVFPDNEWFCGVTPEDVPKLIEKILPNGAGDRT